MSKETKRVVYPVVLFLADLAVGGSLHYLRPWAIAGYSFAAGMAAGSAVLLLAVTFGGWGIREMRRHRTPIEPGRVPDCLVTSGPFRYTRNPLYVALLLIFTALALMINSWWLGLGVGALLLTLDRVVIAREEAVLLRTFGARYADYVARVRRWL